MALNHAIMTALLDDDMSGYELTKRFDTSLGFFWKASHQQIYKALRDLEQQGLLESQDIPQDGKPDKVTYRLTLAGREALEHWVLGEGQVREAKDDLFVKLYNLNRNNLPHLKREIATRAEAASQRLALYRKIREKRFSAPENLPVRQRGVYCALLAGIRHCEMTLNWIDETRPLLEAV